jgi:hypothetical protein
MFGGMPPKPMFSVTCSECKKSYHLDGDSSDYLAKGQIRDLGGFKNYSGICPACQQEDKNQPLTLGAQLAAIRDRATRIRQDHRLSFETATRVAVELEMNPRKEKDEGFRVYLLDDELIAIHRETGKDTNYAIPEWLKEEGIDIDEVAPVD